jgi:serine/threonine protein kinase
METRAETVMGGAQIGSYRIVKQIGAGGMGAVFLAEHMALGRKAALKVLHSQFSTRAEIVTRFFNEARAATAISDPGIVQIFDFGHHTDGSAYIVMELLEGEPLDRRLTRNGPLAPTAALRIMRQVASSLGAAHARGIVHRDLKPENIFIVRDAEVPGGERAKILDFGIAKLAGEGIGIKTQTSAMMGTPMYMSPEQCRGAGEVDQRSDIYALGCVLFALVTGRPPFDAEGVGEIIAMHLREAPPIPSSMRASIPPAIDQLVLRCLSKDPEQRFMNGTELAFAIATLLGSSPDVLVPSLPSLPSRTAIAVASQPTTLSSAAAQSGPIAMKRSVLGLGLAAVAVGGVATFALVHRHKDDVPVAAAPAAVVVADAADPNVRIKEAFAKFTTWSHDHAGAPCPDASLLGLEPSFHVTCLDQPGDQIIGLVTDGPDGIANTADDIASWRLGRDVTELVRGPRWTVAPVVAPVIEKPIAIAVPKPHLAKPAPTPTQTPLPAAKTALQLDENGIPISR